MNVSFLADLFGALASTGPFSMQDKHAPDLRARLGPLTSRAVKKPLLA